MLLDFYAQEVQIFHRNFKKIFLNLDRRPLWPYEKNVKYGFIICLQSLLVYFWLIFIDTGLSEAANGPKTLFFTTILRIVPDSYVDFDENVHQYKATQRI
jgi:hypothetical protein